MTAAHLTELVRDALAHLDDDLALADHELAWELGGGRPLSAERLRRMVLAAVDELGRSAHGRNELRERQHRQLVLRYVERMPRERVAAELGVSLRQASRDLDAAVDAVAAVLRRGAQAPATEHDPQPDLERELTALAAREAGAANVAPALDGAVGTLRDAANAVGSRFRLNVLAGLPAVAVGRTVLRQVFLNLLMYALASAPGRTIDVTGADTAAGVVLRFSADDGRAVADPGEPSVDDLLAAARQLLEPQRGRVERGDPASGGIARLVLPPVPLTTVLVVDDNPDLVQLFRRFLAAEPVRLIQATSGAEARRLAAELRPAVVLLDVMLPMEDGWEILQQLREVPATADIPVIVCSILPERALALSLGVADFLPKPVTAASLMAAIRPWTSSLPSR